MSTKAKWPWVVLLAGIVAFLVYSSGVGGMTKERAERHLAAALPPGTDQSAVRTYFHERGIPVDEDRGKFIGRMRNVNRSFLVQKDLMLIVEIGQDDKVVRTSVTEYLTGP